MSVCRKAELYFKERSAKAAKGKGEENNVRE